MKRAIACLALTFTFGLISLQANAQCSKSSGSCNTGGGHPTGGGIPSGGGFPGGGYPTSGGYPNNGDGYPIGDGGFPATPPYSGTVSTTELGPLLPNSNETGNYGVYIQHPVNGTYALSKDFASKSMAQQYVSNTETRYWVTYRSGDGQLAFKEASSSDAARTLANQLRSQGNEVDKIAAVNARIGKPQEFDTAPFAGEDKQADERDGTAEVAKTTAVPADLSFLVGAWQAVARNESGELTKIELKLDDNGWATLTVPGQDDDTSVIKRRAELKDGQLVLTGEGNDINLGKLASFDSKQVILDRLFGQVTFVRP